MMNQTIAIVIGVSLYKQKEILPLPAAQIDAVHFARSLKNWGLPESKITLFLNENARKQDIENFFTDLSKKKEAFKLLFYFCGHGYRNISSIPKSYLLLHDSYMQENRCSNAISLDSIINKISSLNIQQSYIFIDACYLRINKIINPKLEEELNGDRTSQKNLFCILSSGIQESFESDREQYGYFTEALLHSLSLINRSEGSPTQLLSAINVEMESKGLPLPEVYSIGTQKISLVSPSDFPLLQNQFVYRQEFIAKIQNTIIQNRKKIICLIGELGIGKSAICQILASEKLKTLYLSLPSSPPPFFDPIDFLASTLRERFPECFDPSLSSTQLFREFDKRFPYYLIIIDHLEKIHPNKINALAEIAVNGKVRFLFALEQSLQGLVHEKFRNLFVDLEVPPMTPFEGKWLVKQINAGCLENESDLIYLVSNGSPLKIKKIAFASSITTFSESSTFEKELKKIISAICSCGAYFTECLFIDLFHLEEAILVFLKETGLIIPSGSGFIPHDFLQDMAEAEELPINKQTVRTYWYKQLELLSNHEEVARGLLFAVQCLGYEQKADTYLKSSFQTLYKKGNQYISDLLNSVSLFSSLPHLTEASLFLAEILTELGQFESSQQLLNKKTSSKQLLWHAKLCKTQQLWKMGNLEESIVLSSESLIKAKSSSDQIYSCFHLGISRFLNGDWAAATADFTFIYKTAKEPRYIHRARCMLGSILGVRGVDLSLAKKHLESAAEALFKLEDFSGAWASWNNLGELLWKCGEYKSSSLYLDKAVGLANNLKQEEAQYESLRNLLHLHLRLSGPFSKQATELLNKLEGFNASCCGFLEKGQILNALSTAYLFRKNPQRAIFYLKLATPITSKNKEYHIYTLSNLSILAKLLGMEEKSTLLFSKAIQLAQKGENLLAIHQLKNDHLVCFK